jgi:lipopolysaccharide export system protein LptA
VTIAQQKTTINLIKSDVGTRVIINGQDLEKVYNGVFLQKFSTLRADSAFINYNANTFDAYGHVIITQGDTLHIYADKLNYDDKTKIAILTDHVKMVDKDATLTTNLFNYNTATRYGVYTGGGKLVNKDNVLVSKNGYYFAQSRDAYFRYNVVMTSPDALIKTDTLRYNSGTRISYFYGPTHIYGNKDKDTLYTENGTYNTQTEQAFFGKKNRYSQGTKSLKGDSLFYDKLKGYGKAIKNITFEDTEQRIILKGNLGEYYKADDRAVITIKPYVIFVSEEKDTTKREINAPSKSPPEGETLISPPSRGGLGGAADSMAKVIAAMPAVKNTMPLITDKLKDSVKKAATVALISGKLPANINTPKSVKNIKPNTAEIKKILTDSASLVKPTLAAKDSAISHIKRDTMYIGADTLETQIVTYKVLKDLQEKRRLAGIRDTSFKPRKPFEPYKKIPRELAVQMPKLISEPPSFIHRPLFVTVKPIVKDSVTKKIVKADPKKKLPVLDTLKAKLIADSLAKTIKPPLSDTARIRILSAHHNVHIFKSDLQGKADSLFYSSGDSIIRSFVKPMYWTQGAQISGDTIYLQLKNKKADNMDVFPNALVVYIESGDSTHFNQLGGKRLKAYFKDSRLSRATVKGNAETIYFNRKKGKVSEMERSLSSGITINMKKGEAANIAFITKPDHKGYPIAKVKDDDKILKNFVWKPKERPASKEDVINPKKFVPEKENPKKGAPGKTPAKASSGKPATKDSTSNKVLPVNQTKRTKADTLNGKPDTLKKSPLILKRDTLPKRSAVIK